MNIMPDKGGDRMSKGRTTEWERGAGDKILEQTLVKVDPVVSFHKLQMFHSHWQDIKLLKWNKMPNSSQGAIVAQNVKKNKNKIILIL